MNTINTKRFTYEDYLNLAKKVNDDSKRMIAEMGEKYLCHPANRIKKLDVPLPAIVRARLELEQSR